MSGLTFNKGLICFALLLAAGGNAVAQEQQWERDGEIKDVEIEILRERQITLPRASRNFYKIPPRPSEPIKPEITYTFRNLNFNVPDYKVNARPLKLKQEEITKIYGNFISAGFGNYASPFLEAWLNTKRDKSRFGGAHLYHRSFGTGPIDKKNSASSNTEIEIFGTAFTNTVTAEGNLSYENKGGYFYGYMPGVEVMRDSIRQSYDLFLMKGSISKTKSTDFNFRLDGSFGYLSDHYKAVESEIGLGFSSDYAISEKSRFVIRSDYSLIARKDSLVEAKPRHLWTIKPSFIFSPMEKLTLTLGANAVLENDSIRSKNFHVYPNVFADYSLSKNIRAYASLSGDIDKVTLRTTSGENFWINSNVNIFHTNRSLEFSSGLNGKLGRQVIFNLGFAAANLKDFYFYRNSADRAKFDLVYDRGNVKRLNLFGEVGYNRNEIVRFSLRGDYYTYATDTEAEAWHRPTYRLNINSSFNIYQKLVLKLGLVGQGGMRALNESLQVVKLDPGIDFNARADYHLSRQAAVFLKFENILSNNYPVYLNYPVRGLQVMGGVSWSF